MRSRGEEITPFFYNWLQRSDGCDMYRREGGGIHLGGIVGDGGLSM